MFNAVFNFQITMHSVQIVGQILAGLVSRAMVCTGNIDRRMHGQYATTD